MSPAFPYLILIFCIIIIVSLKQYIRALYILYLSLPVTEYGLPGLRSVVTELSLRESEEYSNHQQLI